MICLSSTHFESICTHGRTAYPEECCGALLGTVAAMGDKQVLHLVRLENQSVERRHRRFEITAEDYKDLELTARQTGLTLLGFYHTHPDNPACPSATDLAYAWPFFSYIILTVSKGAPGEMASFCLDDETMQFVSESIKRG